MTTPNDDELCERLRQISTDLDLPPSIQSMRNIRAIEEAEEAAARIEALIAERDAAVAKACEIAEQYGNAEREGIAEGERRATAAIVGWLRRVDGGACVMGSFGSIAGNIERGDRITEAKP